MKQRLSFLCVWPFPVALTLPERTDLLHQFGAVEVKHITRRGKKQAALAGFHSLSDCQIAVSRIHQLDVLGNRLHAVLWDQSHDESRTAMASSNLAELNAVQREQAQLTALSAQLGLHQPLPPHTRYCYPEPNPMIVANIANALVAVPKFYTQVLHLMNKMNLPEPFTVALPPSELVCQTAHYVTSLRPDDTSMNTVLGTKEHTALTYDDPHLTKESLLVCSICKKITKNRELDADAVPTTTLHIQEDEVTNSSTSESELESDQEQQTKDQHKKLLSLEQMQGMKRSRKSSNLLGVSSRKKARLQLEQEKKFLQQDLGQSKSGTDKLSTDLISDAFRGSIASVAQSSKLQLNIPLNLSITSNMKHQVTAVASEHSIEPEEHDHITDNLRKSSREAEEKETSTENFNSPVNETVSGFGKLAAKTTSDIPGKQITSKFISLEELESNRIKIAEYPVVPVLANYTPGTPSSRLYIKNLAKSVSEQHLRRLYDRYAYAFYEQQQRRHDEPLDIMADPARYHVRVLQEGRMKGQAFVTLPTAELAEQARQHTNGFILQDKPMVVAFGRVKAASS